jgi:pyridoxamine 5'-phosphate oxidase-like protein
MTAMTSCADVASSAPEFADTVQRTSAIRQHATMATVRRDGSPRISGTEVDFADDGEIYPGMMPGPRRAEDLRHDPRVAIHCPTEDTPKDNPASWLGDGKITARAIEVEPHRFRVDVETVALTKVASGGQELEISTWRASGDLKVVRRS